jgi:uncharacterized membrane protein YecN with MAPEG domain
LLRLVHVPVTLLYGGLLTLLVGGLAFNVSRMRLQRKVSVGATLDPQLNRAVRAHGNAAEYVPLQLLLLLLAELAGTSSGWLHALGGSIVLARCLHAGGMYFNRRLVVVGATVSYLVTFALGLTALQAHFR